MQRRNFITGTAATVVASAVVALPLGGSVDCLAAQVKLNTFSPDDTLAQRTEKLNALMGTRFKVRADYPEEWDTVEWNKPGPDHLDEDYLLAATSARLDPTPTTKWTWGVYLEHDGQRWSGNMTPVEYLHWTAQVALGYRIAKVQAG